MELRPRSIDDEMNILSVFHYDANIPDEPYCGVQALFNADLHTVIPSWAPREEWEVVSRYELQRVSDSDLLTKDTVE